MNPEVKKYLKQVKAGCPVALRKRLIPDLQNSLAEYAETHPDATWDSLIARFGEPNHVAADYLADMEDSERIKCLQKAKWVKIAAIVALAVFIAAILFTSVWIICENSRHVLVSIDSELIEVQ